MSRIFLIGETFLNRLTHGTCQKISSEAPIPVFEFQNEFDSLGGVGEIASYLVNLDHKIEIITRLGNDELGRQLFSLLSSLKLNTELLKLDSKYHNGLIQRFVISGHHLLRLENKRAGNLYNHILKLLEKNLNANSVSKKNQYESCAVICDYDDSKEFDPQIFDKISSYFSKLIVDTSIERLKYFPKAKVIRTFFWSSEEGNLSDHYFLSFLQEQKIKNSIENLICSDLNTGNIIFIDHNNNRFNINSGIGDVVDVVGLREGQLAVLVDQILQCQPLYEAAKLASISSRITVRKIGAHIFSRKELEKLKTHL